jgi:ankyrin repeat protein
MLHAIEEGNVDVVREHIEFGKDPNKTFIPRGSEPAGASALHLAVAVEQNEIIELLLKNGADINVKARDQYGGTPLHWAAFLGYRQMAEMLVEAGADINAPDKDGNTPLDGVLSNPDLDPRTRTETVEYLRSIGAKTRD